MMTSPKLAGARSLVADFFRRFSPAILGAQLVLASLFASGLGGCRCPEAARTPTVIPDDELRVNATATLLKSAKANKVWTDANQQAFNESVSHLSFKTRFRFSKQLTGLITSQAIVLTHPAEPEERPPLCTCLPARGVPGGTPGTKN